VRIALAQINATVGDIEGNGARIARTYDRAIRKRAELVVFPELALTGYPPLDLLAKRSFVDANLRALARLAERAGPVPALVGFVDRLDDRLFNGAALLRAGRVEAIQHKTALPNYDVFFEQRHFTPARTIAPLQLGRRLLGVNICEDIWVRGPTEKLVAMGAEVIVNISASPFTLDKRSLRPRMLRALAEKHRLPLLFVNQVGGQDDLIFDGNSFVADGRGRILDGCAAFREDLRLVDLRARPRPLERLGPIEEICEALLLGIRDYAGKNGFTRAVVGVSGGIDSALTLALAVRALGPRQVVGVSMPTAFTAARSLRDAARLARNLGVRLLTLPIEGLRREYLELLAPVFRGQRTGVAEENLQSRIRGNLLMALSNKFGYLVLTTGNKSEVATGYATLYGDMAGGFAVLSDVLKTTVYRLARHLNRQAGRELIPRSILAREPTAELRPGQRDTDVLPAYSRLDPILHLYIEDNLTRREILALGHPPELVASVIRRVDRAEYKRKQMPPGIRITPKAFGSGRMMPITNRWDEAPRQAGPARR
jgi:NAD+ synthase (glutamine-hydrolysing)